MTEFAFPTETFPPLPSLTVEAGEHWQPFYPAGAVLALAWLREPGRFTANVLATATRFDSDYEFDLAVKALDEDLSQLPGAQVSLRDRGSLSNWQAYVQEVAFTHPDAGTLVQCDLLVLVTHSAVSDLLHVVGTGAGDRLDSDYSEVRDVVRSVKISVD